MQQVNSADDTPVFRQIMGMLQNSGIPYRLHTHPAVCTMDEAHRLVPHLTRNLVKTIVFKIKNGHWILAAVHKTDRIDYKKLAETVGVKRTALRSIAPDQVTSELGFQVGGVGPFQVHPESRVVVDAKLSGIGTVFCGSGLNTQTVEMDMDNLIGLAQATVAPITKPAD
jgi:Cys-tRNA(Pro)/Cys-tRNA(Cys) deacylase